MSIDHVKISSIIMSIIGAVLLYLINNPAIVQSLMGNSYVVYGGIVIVIIGIIYNVVFAGSTEPVPEMQ